MAEATLTTPDGAPDVQLPQWERRKTVRCALAHDHAMMWMSVLMAASVVFGDILQAFLADKLKLTAKLPEVDGLGGWIAVTIITFYVGPWVRSIAVLGAYLFNARWETVEIIKAAGTIMPHAPPKDGG
jgi:hypothetical protein